MIARKGKLRRIGAVWPTMSPSLSFNNVAVVGPFLDPFAIKGCSAAGKTREIKIYP
jgi:hypothetical protein